MCIFSRRPMTVPEPQVDPEIAQQKAQEEARQKEMKEKQDAQKKKVSEGKLGRRSLISGQSGGIGFYK